MRIPVILALILYTTLSVAHPFSATAYLVIDTDGGIDDYRAICLLLSAPDVRVLGITASSGMLDAEQTAVKVRALLNSLNREGIPVAVNRDLPSRKEAHGPAAEFRWGDESYAATRDIISLDSLADYLASRFSKKITFVSLGSLSTIMHLGENKPGFAVMVDRVIWSRNGTNPVTGDDRDIDTSLTDRLHHLPVRPVIVQGGGYYSADFPAISGNIWSRTADRFVLSFVEESMKSPMAMRATGEMTAVYLHFPELFATDITDKAVMARYIGREPVQERIADILEEYHLQFHQIMKTLPSDTSYYQSDVQEVMEDIISRHGVAEWNASVQAFEMHRHIGIYALLGAKMGIRAMEYFGAGIDELSVLSHTGNTPPVSCMMDGIQVSTGATVGHGLIRVLEDRMEPVAEFTYLGRTVRISLKEEHRTRIAAEIGRLVSEHGLDSDAYWDKVRTITLRYWLDMCRQEVFEIEKI